MQCEECREAISARLDGEDLPRESAAIDVHLTTCAACRAFSDDAARVTRLARTRVVTEEPDLLPGLLAALDSGRLPDPEADDEPGPESDPPRTRRQTVTDAVRGALAVLSVGQLGLAISAVVAATDSSHHDMALMGASAAHFSHESAAWNLALGVAFGWVALRGRAQAPALVPVIGAFVGVLILLSVPDLLAGRVDAARLVSHGLVVVGLLLLLAHRVLTRGGGGGSTEDVETGPAPAVDRAWPVGPADSRFGDGDDHGLKPTAHRAA